ncbi:hypothetical protein NQ318_004107 [Aromia moschata]|uniref:Uncharacterized protein n=1 Tax=Aromia moschata TaxID=1265417 RepID=A0AAV8XUZ4_9CUCU|nr:hypothetical protein NQ318_004107 [Aromia moschata]
MLQRLIDDDGFLRNIVFSDEATFYLDGTVNPGIVGNHILDPFFIEGALTDEKYLEFLRFGPWTCGLHTIKT